GVDGNPSLAYALRLARRGFVTISPDYPRFGELQAYDPYSAGYISSTMNGVHNHMVAVTVLTSLPNVRQDRIGSIGHSLGGSNSLFLAAFDTRVVAAVENCGFTPWMFYGGGDISNWGSPYYMPRINSLYAGRGENMPWDWFEILQSIAPRSVMALTADQDYALPASGVQFATVWT